MSELWAYLVAIVVLQGFSAFFSGSETALTTASRGRLHQLAQEGNAKAKLTEGVRAQKDKLLGTILVGNTFVNSAAAAVATTMLGQIFADTGTGAILATLLITVTLLIFSEVLPKTYAIHHATSMAMVVAPFMRVLMWLLTPFTWGIIAIVRGILVLVGADGRSVAVSSNVEELKGAIDLHRGPDAEVAQERAMLRSILDLNAVEVKSAMTHRRQVETINASLPIDLVIEEALASRHSRIPIWRDNPDNIIGILHTKTLYREILKLEGKVEGLTAEAVMIKPWFIPESTSLLDQLQAFQARREHFALVVDEYGELQGVITLEDILEEIVGNIEDEHDVGMPGVVKQPNGSFVIDGTVTVRELNRQFDWRLPDAEAATIAGYVLFEARKVPDVGQTFEFHGFRFEIMKRHRNQIMQLRVWPPAHLKGAVHAAH